MARLVLSLCVLAVAVGIAMSGSSSGGGMDAAFMAIVGKAMSGCKDLFTALQKDDDLMASLKDAKYVSAHGPFLCCMFNGFGLFQTGKEGIVLPKTMIPYVNPEPYKACSKVAGAEKSQNDKAVKLASCCAEKGCKK